MKKSRQIKKSAFTLAEVPEARHHIGHWPNAFCHCEERSDVAIAKLVNCNGNAITTSNAAHSLVMTDQNSMFCRASGTS